MLEVADVCSLTLDGAHRLFGYDIGAIRDHDVRLNGGRTHIVESYPFRRDIPIDLPSRLASSETFRSDGYLRDFVFDWQTEVPIRALDAQAWSQPGVFYVHVGTEDSLGSSIPPGALALVEPVGSEENAHPDPRAMYLLQFGNGYRCVHCVVSRGKLRLFSSAKVYLGREEFVYPGGVRIAGRIRMFALSLPAPEYPSLGLLPDCRHGADLILPWEHQRRDRLLATKRKRFKRSKEESGFVKEFLKEELNARLSGRTERRYRRPTSSEPHVNALMHLAVSHVARYTDTLRTGGVLISDRGRFSLEALLNARFLEEVSTIHRQAHLPTPNEVWEARREEFVEWPPLLSMKFPQLRLWSDRLIRLAHGSAINNLDPQIG